MTNLETQFQQLRATAGALRAGTCNAHALANAVDHAAALIDTLPPAYRRTIDDIVTRFESAALFGAESCSFSLAELHDALAIWLEKAEQRLGLQTTNPFA